MKKIIPLILVFFVGFAQAQRKPKIKGNKNVVEVKESLPPFNAIVLEDDLEVVLQKSFDEGYTLKVDDNLIDVLKFEVLDSTLSISSFYKIIGKKKLDIQINYKELTSITMRSGKLTTMDVISTDELYVETSGPSRLELNSNAGITHLMMKGISSGDLNLASDSLNMELNDRIDARIYIVGEGTAIAMNKNATARLEGSTDNLYVDLMENANLKAEKLEAGVVEAFLEASSDARIRAMNSIDLTLKGSSKTQLFGNPKITISEFLDSAQLLKKTD